MTSTTLNQSPVVVQTFMGALYSSQYYAADNGAVNAISIPLAIAPNAYTEGIIWFTKFAQTNTSGTVTAKVGSLAALPVVIDQAGTLPIPGSIIQNMFGMLTYSAAQNKLILINPSRSFSSYTLTLTGMTGTTTGTAFSAVSPDGKTVFFRINVAITGTSNATTMTGTGIPAAYVPATANALLCKTVDSGATGVGFCSNAATFSFGKLVGGVGGFTNSGSKGLDQQTMQYTLD